MGLFQILQKERFFMFDDNQVLLGLISQCDPFSCIRQKRPSSSFQFGQEENIPGHSSERRVYWFVLKIARVFPIHTSRNRMMNTFTIVTITHSPFSSARNRKYLGTYLREKLTNLFWKLPGYSLFPHSQNRQKNVNTLLMVNINVTLDVRDSLEYKSMLLTHFYLM